MKELAGVLTSGLMLFAAVWYIPLIIRARVKPALATWILGAAAMDLSAVSFWNIPGRTLIENILLFAAAVEITVVLGVLVVVLWRRGELKVSFDPLQKGCILVMFLVLAYWMANKERAGFTFWTTQVLLVVAYVATVGKAVRLRKAFDSIGNWSLILLGSVVGLVPAVLKASPYGITNSVRAIVSAGITVGLLCFFDNRNGWSRWRDELEHGLLRRR